MYCRRCGAPVHQGIVICPECGARQQRRASSVRCASCGGRVSLELTVCPHCGRNLRPAGPRWGLWLGGFVVVVLVGLWGLGELPVERIRAEVIGVRDRVGGLVQVLGSIVPREGSAGSPTATAQAVARVAPTPVPARVTPVPTPTVRAEIGPEGGEIAEPAQADTETAPTVTGTAEPTASPIAEPTASPTAVATVSPTTAPTDIPTSTPTAVPPTPTQAPSATPPTATRGTPAGRVTTYQVQAGDTLSTIGTRFNVPWQDIAAANGLTGSSRLQVGQQLVIPLPGAAPAPAATVRPRPAVTPTASSTPEPSLPAPVLKNPGDQASYKGGGALIELNWEPVPGMASGDRYQVIIRWVEQGVPQEHAAIYTPLTGTSVPSWLWSRADQPARQYQWFVRVVRQTTDGRGNSVDIPLSPPSQARVFYWN